MADKAGRGSADTDTVLRAATGLVRKSGAAWVLRVEVQEFLDGRAEGGVTGAPPVQE